jgi:phage terminase large subunit
MPFPPELWYDWNPTNEDDAIEQFFQGNVAPEDRDLPSNMVLVDVSYKDNPWLPDDIKDEIAFDFRRDPEMAAHVWSGAYEQRSEARVFNNWHVDEFVTPSDAVFLYGADWGFSVDPTVLVRMFIKGRTLFIDRELYKVGLPIDHCPLFFGGMRNGKLNDKNKEAYKWLVEHNKHYEGVPGCEQWEITADSARPETIDYMRRHGFTRMVPSVKGPNSIQEGVEFMREFDIVIHPDCTRAVNEFTHYKYKIDKHTGIVLPVLEDKKNHYIDAIRYALEKRRKKRKRAGVM